MIDRGTTQKIVSIVGKITRVLGRRESKQVW
jgi:hypothetical protein